MVYGNSRQAGRQVGGRRLVGGVVKATDLESDPWLGLTRTRVLMRPKLLSLGK